ncbi:hypothetical protein U9M48_011238 [Paspalum notatum var. saurae]|uniref:Uncharacterized protein n=1 Tax=Paspalum notatum var. saurae TaxID=547442 RepID=A0AAQ3WGY9_PASNO
MDRVRNDEIRDRLGVAPIEEKLVQHRLRWFGHVQRRPPEAPVHSGIIRRNNEGSRPNLTWEKVKRDLRDWNIVRELALDRAAWKAAIHLLPCAINASCAALAFAGVPLKHLAVAIGCGVMENGAIILDTSTAEEQQLRSFAHLVFPNSRKSVDSKEVQQKDEELERGLIACTTHGAMSEDDYFNCIERGLAASLRISDFMRKALQKQAPEEA